MSNLEPMATPSSGPDAKTWILAIHISYLVGFGIVGLIIAYVKRPELVGTIWASHITYAIRTFWIGLAAVVVGCVLTLVLIGIFLIWAAAIWVLVRAVVGVIRAASDQPIANPETWLI